jgi:hypothetical protein
MRNNDAAYRDGGRMITQASTLKLVFWTDRKMNVAVTRLQHIVFRMPITDVMPRKRWVLLMHNAFHLDTLWVRSQSSGGNRIEFGGFGLVVVSQRIWRSQSIFATARPRSLVPRCWEWRTDNDIGRSLAGGLPCGFRRVEHP